MRRFFAVAAFSLFSLTPVRALSPTPVTLLLDFELDHSDQSVQAMRQEMDTLFAEAGLRFDVKLREDLRAAETFPEVVVVKLKGRCSLATPPMVFDERGPLAFTHTSEGHVLPFSEVQCDKVARSLRTAMLGSDYRRADQLLGRALGRVLAHEVYHIFAQTGRHGERGVAKTALSGAQLLGDRLPFDEQEIEKLKSAPRR